MKLNYAFILLLCFSLSSCGGSGGGGGGPSPGTSCWGKDWIDYSDLSGIPDGTYGPITNSELMALNSASYSGLTTSTPAYRTTNFFVINTSSSETDVSSMAKYAKTLEKLLAFELDRLDLNFSDLNLSGKQKYVAGGSRMPFIVFNNSNPGQGNGGSGGDAGSVSMNSINNPSARKTIHHEFIHTLDGLLTQGALKNFYNGYWFSEGIATYLSGQCTNPSASDLESWSKSGGVNDVLLKDWRATEYRVANIYFVGASATAYLFKKGDITTEQLGAIWKESGRIDSSLLNCTGFATTSDCINNEAEKIWRDETGKDFAGYNSFEGYRQNFFHGQKLYQDF